MAQEVYEKGRPDTAPTRFEKWAMPEPNSGCWLWLGALTDGYGRLGIGARMVPAHRFAYEHFVGPIPDGLEIDHKCRIRCCVNPTHLEPVTHIENVRRGLAGQNTVEKARTMTHCAQGHPYEGANVKRRPNGRRYCAECARRRMRNG